MNDYAGEAGREIVPRQIPPDSEFRSVRDRVSDRSCVSRVFWDGSLLMKTAVVFASLFFGAPIAASFAADFKTEILPIFESRCFRCHGNGEAKGSLSLDPEEISKHIRRSGQISPGNAARSILVERLVAEDSEDRMPKNGAALSEDQIELIKKWIDDGAQIGDAPTEGDGEKKEAGSGLMKRPEPIKGSWTNREGRTIEATLLRVEGDNAVLKLANGTSVPYPIANLSDESQAKVREFQKASQPGQ